MKKHLLLAFALALLAPWAMRAQSCTQTVPYSEDFESYTGTTYSASTGLEMPTCWNGFSSSTSTTNVYMPRVVSGTGSYVYYHGAKGFAMTGGTATTYGMNKYVLLPPMNVPLNQLQISFWMCTESNSATYGTLVVGYVTSDDTSTFTPIQSYPSSAATYHSGNGLQAAGVGLDVELVLSTVPSTATRLAFKWEHGNSSYHTCCIDDIVVTYPPTCPRVDYLTATPTSDEVTLAWTEMGTASAWEVTISNATGVVSSDNVYTNPATITNLSPNTNYTASIRAICGAGDTSLVRSIDFHTLCAPIETTALPWTYGVEDASGTGASATFNSCIQKHTNYSTAYPYPSSTQKHSGNYAFYFYSTSAYYSYLTLPPFEEDLENLYLTFWAYKTSTNYGHVYVGVMSNPADITTFDTLATMQVNATSSWEYFEVSLSGYTGNGGVLAILSPSMSAASYVYIDDISVNYPPACPTPADIVSSNATSSTIDVSWTSSASEFIVEYGLQGTDQGSGTVVTASTNSITLQNLLMGMTYDVYVTAVCGNDTSNALHGTVTVGCGSITAADLPYSEDFETYGSGSAYPINACWHKGVVAITGSGTTTNYPYPSATAINGTRSLYFYTMTSTSNSYYNWMVLPPIDETMNLSDLMVTFQMKRSTTASYNSRLVVGVTTDYTTTAGFVPIDTIDLTSLSTGSIQNVEVSFENYTDTGRYVLFYAPAPTMTGTTTVYNNFYIDDITLRAIPSCYWPTDVAIDAVSNEEATLSWTPDSRTPNPSSWVIEYGPHGFIPGNGETETVYDTTVTLTSLLANTLYDVYVSADCGGDVSDPASFSFRTLCTFIDTLPYSYGFEDLATGSSTVRPEIPCWHHLNNGTSSFGYPYVYASAAHTGSRGLYWYGSTTTGTYGDYQMVVLPGVDTDIYPINTLRLNFWARPSSTSYYPVFQVGVMTDPTDATTFQLVQTVNVANVTTWQEFTVQFGGYTGSGNFIAVRMNRPSSSLYAYTDDFTISVAPTCAPVVSHHVIATASAARITWSSDPSFASAPESYDVSYGFAADSLVGATATTVTGSQMVLTGLVADTSYIVSVSPICDGATSTPYIFNFTTQHLPCIEWDTTGNVAAGPSDTLTVGNPGTSTTAYMPVNNSYNYSYTQHLILASHISTTGPTTFGGIAFDYAYSQPMTHATNCQIYMGNTTRATFTVTSPADSAFVPYSQLQLVYSGPLNCTTNGYNYFQFNEGAFQYDGTSNIVVAIVNNSGSYDGSSYVFRYETASSPNPALTHRVYNNNTPYGPTEMDAARANQSYWRTNMKLVTGGGGECLTQASCFAPNVTAELNDAGNVQVDWLPGYQETAWDLDYRTSDDTVWTSVLSGTTLTTYTFLMEDLQPMTEYLFRVTPNCTDTILSTTATFTTPCSYISIPYTYGFEGLPTGTSSTHPNIPCWHHLNNGTSYPGYPYIYASAAHTGSNGLYWYLTTTTGTYGDYEVVVLPPVDITTNPINTLQLSFWAKPTSTSYAPVFQVGVMTDPSDVNTFQMVNTVNVDHATTDWNPYEVVLSSYTGSGRYVAIRANRPSSAWYAHMDDIALENIPNCPRVTDVVARNIGQSTATIGWDTTSAFDYEVQYGPANFILGTGTTLAVSYADSVDIMGLSANTPYDVYVRGICTPDTGNWSFITTFRTECGVIDVLPFSEDFESYPTYSSSSSSTPFIPCWTRLNNGTTYGGTPYVGSSTYNHTPGGAKGVYWYATTTATTYGDYMYVILPPIDTIAYPINTLQLTFWSRSSSATYYPVFEVGVMNNNTDTAFQHIATINVGNSAEWTEYTTGFNTHMGSGRYIAIRALRPTSTWYAYIDDVTLDVLPACPRVEDLTVSNVLLNGATISWTDTSSNTGWSVEYDTMTFAPGTGHVTAIHVTDTFCVLTGLDSGTVYHVYVYPDCGNDVSERYISFTTLAASPATVPYFCDFEAAGVNGWDLLTTNQTNYWMIGSAVNNGGAKALYVTNDGNTNSYTISSISYSYAVRNFQLTDTGEYAYSFDWKGQGEGNYDFVRALFVPASENIEAGVLNFGTSAYNYGQTVAPAPWIDLTGRTATPYGLNMQGSWQNRTGVMHISTPGTYKLVFAWVNDGSGGTQPPAAIDNVSLVRNTCAMPQNVTAALTGDSISITWTPGDSESAWELTLGTTTVVATTTAYTFTGLTPNTYYTFSIRSICGAGDSSLAYTETYHTPCGAVSVPYTENFDGLTTGTATSNLTVMPSCWDYILTGSSTYQGATYYPGVYYSSSNAHSGSYSLRLYGQGYHMLPPMSVPLDSLQLTFWDYTTSTSYGLEVGVMEGNTFVPVQVISSPTSTHVQHTVYFGTYTGTSRIIAFRNWYTTSATTYYSYHYLDDVEVDYLPTCPPVVDIHATAASTSSITVDWTDQATAAQWQVRYGLTSATTTTLTVNSHPVTLTGLDTLTSYVVSVRPICSATDTGDWSPFVSLATEVCDNAVAASTGSPTGTSYYTPVNNFYKYTLSETIIDSAELFGIGDITAIAYSYNYATAMTDKTDVTIWLQPTNKSVFSSGSDLVLLDTTIAVQVYHGNLNCQQGWNYFQFDTTYVWDGHSNLLVIVDDNSNDYNSSSYLFNTSSCTGYKTLVWYSDSYDADPTNSTYSGTKTYYQYRATMKLVSCGASCYNPVIDTLIAGESTVTLNWRGSAANYEVAAVPGNWAEPSAPATTTGTTYTFTGLASGTLYSIGVRAVCGEGFYSEWAVNTVTTIEHPCYAPSNVNATNITFGGADITWTPGEASQTDFQLRYSTGGDTTFVSVNTNPYTLTGLANATEYSVAVRAVCGEGDYSDWSAPATFTTAACPTVTNVTATATGATTATVSWNGSAASYQIEYGYMGFTQGNGTRVDVSGTSYNISGLESETNYDVYVRSVCGDNNYSGWSDAASFETQAGSGVTYTVTVTVNDPSMGSVSGAGTYEEGATVTLRATSNAGYHFVNWNDGMTDSVRTFVINSNMSFTANFAANGTQGIDDVEGSAISLYPNPASNMVTLTGIEGAATVTVVDMNGRESGKWKVESGKLTIDVSQLSQGAYFVRITGERVNAIRKLIVR